MIKIVDDEKELGIWELYGLRTNPFSTNPLLVKGGVLPIDCFIGRKEELTQLSKQFRSSGGSRTLVVGDVGVGKTTFVNVARYKAISDGKFFTPFSEVGVQETWTAFDFVLNTLYAIYSSLYAESSEKLISKEAYRKLERVVGMDVMSARGFGISVMGSGVDLSNERTGPIKLTFTALKDLLNEIIQDINKSSKKEVILHYNNLERIKENKVRQLFEDLRDTLQTPNAHFVFVGNFVVGGIIQSVQRVASIFSEVITIKELTLNEIKEVIDLRLKRLGIEDLNITKPYEDAALRLLYELYGGNIRNILNSLGAAVLQATDQLPIRLSADELSIILKTIAERKLKQSGLQPKALEILKRILEREEVTNKNLAELVHTSRSNVSIYIRDLHDAGFVFLKRRKGKDKYWSADPRLKWMLLEPKNKGQPTLSIF